MRPSSNEPALRRDRYFLAEFNEFSALAADSDSFTFEGAVTEGQSYSHPLSHGLEFTLSPGSGNAAADAQPRSDGWRIGIRNEVDTASFANGPNPTDIFGWHFCSDEATGLPFGLLERHFRFTVSESEAKASVDQYWCKRKVDDKCSISSERHNESACRILENEKCDALFQPRELLYVTFRITNYTLDKPPSSKFCFIKSINFTVSGEYAPSKEE